VNWRLLPDDLAPNLLALALERFNRSQSPPVPHAAGAEFVVLPTDSLLSATNSFDPIRLLPFAGLAGDLVSLGKTPFPPLLLANDKVLLPPIAEESDSGPHMLLDGTHRALAATRQGLREISVLSIRLQSPLDWPCSPHSLSSLWPRDPRRYSKEELFTDLRITHFRRTEWASEIGLGDVGRFAEAPPGPARLEGGSQKL
jgi:hypothetical protein